MEEFARSNLPPGSASTAKKIFESAAKQEEEGKDAKKNEVHKPVYRQPDPLRHGTNERFPAGTSWYDFNHTVGQLGFARNNESFDTFYSAAAFRELEEKVRKGGMRPPKKAPPPRQIEVVAEETENIE